MPRRVTFPLAVAFFGLALAASSAADFLSNPELYQMNLSGEGSMPLGADWGYVQSSIELGESPSFTSGGELYAADQGTEFSVSGFIDLFFNITFTDVDPLYDFAGQADGASLVFADIGPARVESAWLVPTGGYPALSLFPPPESAPYLGFLGLEIPLGTDLNGNGELDKIKFILASLAFVDEGRIWISLPDDSIVNGVDVIGDFSGSVVDLSADPPFSFQLTGPAAAISRLSSVPEPSTIALLGLGLARVAMRSRRRDRPSTAERAYLGGTGPYQSRSM